MFDRFKCLLPRFYTVDLPRCPWCEEPLRPGEDVIWKQNRSGNAYAYHEECDKERKGKA